MRHLRVGKVVVDRRSRTRMAWGRKDCSVPLWSDCQTDPKLEAPVGLRFEQNFLFPHRGGTLWILNKS
ncbi:hypothetical protein [Sinorhizobium sp. P24N7]|jgi:hypothetical protein|uniref:hypothetical protein n=1 Tax=unclassified Sinorhizobium TaxID=2613772 RepID=UPI0035F34573